MPFNSYGQPIGMDQNSPFLKKPLDPRAKQMAIGGMQSAMGATTPPGGIPGVAKQLKTQVGQPPVLNNPPQSPYVPPGQPPPVVTGLGGQTKPIAPARRTSVTDVNQPTGQTDWASQQQNPYKRQAEETVADAYREYLGREPTQEEIDSHFAHGQYTPQAANHAVNQIRNSPEARPAQTGPNPVQPSPWNVTEPEPPATEPPPTTEPPASTEPGGPPPPADPSTLPPPPPGFDANKWYSDHNSIKYQAGRILAKYPPTTEGMQQAWAEIQKYWPNATFNGKDKIDFGDGYGPIDVLVGASQGGVSWAWQPSGQGGEVRTGQDPTNPEGPKGPAGPDPGADDPSDSPGLAAVRRPGLDAFLQNQQQERRRRGIFHKGITGDLR